MWYAFYNPNGVGDVLMLTIGPLNNQLAQASRQDNVAVIVNHETNQVVSINIFHARDLFTIEGTGQVLISKADEAKLNQIIKDAGFDVTVELDRAPKFVVGHVDTCQKHEDSNHLSVTQTNVGDETVQIVCGASNIDAGLDVIVALPGAMLPSGSIIWPGELRGVKSNGMICSTRELGLTDIEDLPGIWELPDGFQPGTPLSDVVSQLRS